MCVSLQAFSVVCMPWIIRSLLFIGVPLAAMNWYVGRRCVQAFSSRLGVPPSRVRAVLLPVAVFANLLPIAAIVAFSIGGRDALQAFSGENHLVDILLVYPFWTWLVVLVQLFLCIAVWDIGRSLIALALRGRRELWKVRTHTFVVYAAAIVAVYSVVRLVSDSTTVRVVRVDVRIPREFSGLDGVKIVHVSDVQGDGRTDEVKIAQFVELCNSLKPDIALNSGDQVTSGEKYIASTARLLGELKPVHGHFAAVGDHDIFSSKTKMLTAMRDNGIVVEDDTSILLSVRDVPVWLSMVTYTYPQKPDSVKLERIFNAPDSTFRILLIHQPAERVIDMTEKAGYHLALAGHTHGGGIAFGLPGIGVLSPASFESKYVSGVYHAGHMTVNVTNGLGFTLAPIRFQAPLDVTLLTLRAER